MAKVYSLEEAQRDGLFEDASIAFGVFDGFHVGHRFLVGEAVSHARANECPAVVLTFDIDPDELFRGDELKKLCGNEQRLDLLSASGVDAVVALAFDRRLAATDPLAFLERTFYGCVPESIHIGVDFRFGSKGSGTVDDLRFWAERTGTRVFAYQLVTVEGEPVTATRIRGCLERGEVAEVAQYLDRNHSIFGTVVGGRQQGREMGFRTANLSMPSWQCLPGEGVYAAYAFVSGQRYKAALSMGVSPTFEDATAQCEVHVLDFEGDLYGQQLTVEFVKWLRPMIKFSEVSELMATVNADFQWCRDNL